VGKVGHALVKLLVEQGGAEVIVSDVDVDSVARAVREFGADTAASDQIDAVECDVFAPCALGGIINDESIPKLRCGVVAGSANNQLERPEHGKALQELGILYAPDFVVNAGGLINVADELHGYKRERAKASVESVYRTLREVFTIARHDHISTAEAAERFAQSRIDKISHVRLYWVPGGPT
jgi:leucine dehydrogenase